MKISQRLRLSFKALSCLLACDDHGTHILFVKLNWPILNGMIVENIQYCQLLEDPGEFTVRGSFVSSTNGIPETEH